jgi:hypothetical protein
MVVSAHYDGKGGRAVDAQVIKARKGVVIAEFVRWAGEGRARVRFVDGGGWDAGGECMPAVLGLLGCRARRRGDWYGLGPRREPRQNTEAAAVVRMCRVAAELYSAGSLASLSPAEADALIAENERLLRELEEFLVAPGAP